MTNIITVNVSPSPTGEHENVLRMSMCRDGSAMLMFRCPGCGFAHGVQVGSGVGPRWAWEGGMVKPTFTPSVMLSTSQYVGPDAAPSVHICHSFVKGGRIQFLDDSTHPLKGQTIDLKPWNRNPTMVLIDDETEEPTKENHDDQSDSGCTRWMAGEGDDHQPGQLRRADERDGGRDRGAEDGSQLLRPLGGRAAHPGDGGKVRPLEVIEDAEETEVHPVKP